MDVVDPHKVAMSDPMAKSKRTSWMPKTGSWSVKRDGAKAKSAPGPTVFENKKDAKSAAATESEKQSSGRYMFRSSVSGAFTLPNGDRISTVRKDVMDSALGRDRSRDKK